MEKESVIKRSITIKIDGYYKMDPEIDKAFFTLFAGFLTNATADIDLLASRYFPDFEIAAIAYFTRYPITTPIQNQFINNLTPIWNALLDIDRLGPAQQFWEQVLSLIKRLEKHYRIRRRIHKGSIYYYWGGTAIKNEEIEKGYELMHLALIEDRKTYKAGYKGTPAYKFVYLDYIDTNQHFIHLLTSLVQVLNSYLPNYQSLSASKLNSTDFRSKLLATHPKPEVILLLAYTLSRIEQRFRYPPTEPKNAYAGVLDLNMLFDLVLVIDTSIQAKSKVGWEFFNLARHLSKSAGLDLSQSKLEYINCQQKKKGNFAKVVISLLNHSLPMPDGKPLSQLATDIAIAFCIRNHAAHNIASQKLVPAFTKELLQALFDVLFLTTDILY